MRYRLLGELRVIDAGGRELPLGLPRQQAVLAVLLVDAGRPVPAAAVVDRIWGDAPPAQARNVLYSQLSRIRAMFAGTAVRVEPAR